MKRTILSVPKSWPVAPDLWRAVVQFDRPTISRDGVATMTRHGRKIELCVSGLMKGSDGVRIEPGGETRFLGVTFRVVGNGVEARDLVGECEIWPYYMPGDKRCK